MANPTLLDMPIARDGNKNAIPTTDNGTTGLLSQQYGWQLINAIPPQQGGKAVKREDFNGALYLLSNLLFYLQKGWQFEWDANQNYYAGCIVKDPNNGKMYQRLNDGTSNTAPHADTTNWKLWDLSMLANYLPLSGGTITGDTDFNADLIMRASKLIRAYDDTNAIHIVGGGGTSSGGELVLYGRQRDDRYAGAFALLSMISGGSEKTLFGYPDGTLTWGNNDLGGSSIVAKDFAYNSYRKTADGMIMQWGFVERTSNDMSVVFPISYSTRTMVVATPRNTSSTAKTYCTIANKTITGFDVSVTDAVNYVDWIAIGF